MKRALALLVFWSANVAADPKADAQAHIDNASQLYKDGKFTDALLELNTAYTLDPQPELLYAIGQIHVKLGNCKDAVTFYERFLATHPDPDAASATKQAITACKNGTVGEGSGSGSGSDAGSGSGSAAGSNAGSDAGSGSGSAIGSGSGVGSDTGPPEPPTWYSDKLADGLVIGGTVSALIGVVLYSQASSKLDDADAATTYQNQQSLVDDAHSQRNLSIVFDVAAAGLIGYGVYHYLHFREAANVTVTPAPGGGAVTWTGHF
jgi:tetratricopeptide (TPR) repeat protein